MGSNLCCMKPENNLNSIQELEQNRISQNLIEQKKKISKNNDYKSKFNIIDQNTANNSTNRNNDLVADLSSVSNNLVKNQKLQGNEQSNLLFKNNDEQFQNTDLDYINQLKEIDIESHKLQLEIINSLTFDKGTKIIINPLGLESDSLRNVKDGFTFFGYYPKEELENLNPNQQIDFLVKTKDQNFEQRIIGRHFSIRFNLEDLSYYIKDLGNGYGTFMKITQEIQIKDNYLINIGNSFIVCTFGLDEIENENNDYNEEDKDKILNIKVFGSDSKTFPYFFNPNEIRQIFIGRDISNNIIIDDSLLSRIHCTIEYYENKGWVINDGNTKDINNINKPSTNGTWLYLIDDTKIENGMIFKSSQNIYECHLTKK